LYASRVPSAVLASVGQVPGTLLAQMRDPQALVDRRMEDSIRTAVHNAGILEVLRHTLASSIHIGFLLTAIAAALAVWKVRAISHLRFRKVKPESAFGE
jgi:hypothetical protein